ncbi:MAG: DUF1501 domain-containing protein [Planctomycetota bacterium]|jgi:uncharacterized protein (DUF1501 family)
MNTSRRDFLRLAAAAGVLSQVDPFTSRLVAAVPGYAQQPQQSTRPALVVIFLRGAADGLNMIVPHGDPSYEASRPTLAMALADGLIPMDDTFALHPAMSALKPMWEAGTFAPVVCAGSPHRTRSHFDAQDWMEFAAPGDRTMREGWLNRYLEYSKPEKEEASEFRALGMQELLPRSLRGRFPVLAVPTSLGRRKTDRTLDRFEQFYGDGSDMMEGGSRMSGDREEDPAGVVASGRITIDTLRRFTEIIKAGEKKRGKGTQTVSGSSYPTSRFGNRMKQIALVLRADEGMEVAGIDYGGWDDHTREGSIEGRMADRMKDLSQTLAAFCQDLGPQLATTNILVMTEFGRTVRENGNNGTDHGHGGNMLLLGGGVQGGKIHGDWRGMETSALYQGRDLAVTTDFRDVFHSVLENAFGFEAPKDFFPGYEANRVKGLY